MQMYLGIAFFVFLFLAWVVVPPIIKKRHGAELEEKTDE